MVPNKIVRERTKVTDVIEKIAQARWRWAGNVACLNDNRCTRRLTEWRSGEAKRTEVDYQKGG